MQSRAAFPPAVGYDSGSTSAQGSAGRGQPAEVKIRDSTHRESRSKEAGGPGLLSEDAGAGSHLVPGHRSHAANQFVHNPDYSKNSLNPLAVRKKKHPSESREHEAQNKPVSTSVKKRVRPVFGEDETKASLSHKRRIKHLIEQSRLRSRFGQLFGQTRAVVGLDKLSVPSSDAQSCWDNPDPDLDGSSNDFPSNINNDLLINGTQQSHMVPLKSRTVDQDSDKLTDSNNSNTEEERLKYDCQEVRRNSRTSRTSKDSSSLGEDIRHSCDESQSASDEVDDGSVWGQRWPGASPMSRLAVSQRYMDKLAEQLASSVKISVPKFQYSKVGSVDRSQTMHF